MRSIVFSDAWAEKKGLIGDERDDERELIVFWSKGTESPGCKS